MWHSYQISNLDLAIKAFSEATVALRLAPEKEPSAAIRKRIRVCMQ